MKTQGLPNVDDPRFTAAIALIGRTGAKTFQIRYDDDPEPTVWVADVEYKAGRAAAGGLSPFEAVMRLAEQLVDGAICVHCGRVSAMEGDWTARLPLENLVCWYVFDPELAVFRRGCEGDEDLYHGIGRNDPCPCGSGLKFKRCHGEGPRAKSSDTEQN